MRARLIDGLGAHLQVVRRITPAQLSLPTPCEGWNVRDVLNHAAGVTAKFAAFAAGETDSPRTPPGDLLGDDVQGSIEQLIHHAITSWRAADTRRACHLPFGTFSTADAAGINLFDVLAHTWDVAVASQHTFECSDELWTAGLSVARRVIGPARDPAHYGPERPVSTWAPPRERFLAFLGRR